MKDTLWKPFCCYCSIVHSSGAANGEVTPLSVRWFYKVEACIIIHMSLCMLSHITAWTQGRPLLPALRNSDRFLTIPLSKYPQRWQYCFSFHYNDIWWFTNIMKDLQWPFLEQRRKANRLAILYKIQNDQIAIPIPHYLHRQTAQTWQFHPQRFRTVAIHSDTYKHSFFPCTIKDWNSLTPSMYDAKSLVFFKQCIQNV